jgi:hypothetical protein
VVRNTGTAERNVVHLKHRYGADVVIACGKDIVYGGALALCGAKGNATVVTADTFSSFKAQLAEFVGYLRSGVRPYPFSHTAELMRLVIAGLKAANAAGSRCFYERAGKFSLKGRVALLTGGAGLYGRQIAEALAEAGAATYIASRNVAELERWPQRCARRAAM